MSKKILNSISTAGMKVGETRSMTTESKQPSEALQRDWSMREIKEKEYQELKRKAKAYDQIMSSDSSKAMKELKKLGDRLITGGPQINQTFSYDVIRNFILQEQAREIAHEKQVNELSKLIDHNLELERETVGKLQSELSESKQKYKKIADIAFESMNDKQKADALNRIRNEIGVNNYDEHIKGVDEE